MLLSFTLAVLSWLSAIQRAGAQVPSSSWRMPNLTTSVADRVSLAGAALDKAISNLTSGQFNGQPYGVPGTLYAQMAEFDIATGQKKYEAALAQYFPLAQSNRLNFSDELCLNYGLTYGRAAARAYVAYQNRTFLDYAVQNWWYGNSYTISAADAAAGSTPAKSITLASLCEDITMAGGTFWETDSGNPSVNGLGTGNFLVLSALLAEATSDSLYLSAAAAAVEFMRGHLYNANNLVMDTIAADSTCLVSNSVFPYNSGLMIHGLAILANITGNATYQTLLDDILTTAVPNTAWQGSNGVVGDGEMVQGLTAVYTRNSTSTPAMRTYVEAYFAVQYNAIIGLATTNGTNVYAGSWVGPPSAVFSGGNQTAALNPLIGGLFFINDTTPSSPASPSSSLSITATPTPSTGLVTRKKKSDIGAIVGGVLGGVAALGAAVIALLLFLHRRRAHARSEDTSTGAEPALAAEVRPFYPWRVESEGLQVTEYGSGPSTSGDAPTSEMREVPEISYSHGQSPGQKAEVQLLERPREKQGRIAGHAPEASAASISGASGSGIAAPESAPRERENRPQIPTNLPTEELVRLLNERLQYSNHEWNDDELPPDYAVPDHE